MLIVGLNSTCDICMESYMEVAGMPHVIPCGHIFCRGTYSAPNVPFVASSSHPGISTNFAWTAAVQVRRGGHATVEEMQRAVDQCNAYHDLHPGSSLRIPLGVSRRLVTSHMEAHRKLFELASARDDIRDRLILHLEFAQTQYRTLDQVRRSEKETTLKNEEDSRTRYDEMNTRWRSSVESMTQKCQSLCEELDQLRQTNQTATHGNASNVVQRNSAATSRRSAVVRNSSGRVVHRSLDVRHMFGVIRKRVCRTPFLAVTSFVEEKVPDVSTECISNPSKTLSPPPDVLFVAGSSRPRISTNFTWIADAQVRFESQLQRLLDGIEKIVDGRATVEEMQSVVDQCDAYHDSRPGSSLRVPLGVSHRLLTSLLEAQRKLSELLATNEDDYAHLAIQLEMVQEIRI
ncbi:hypothetical protein JVT61DRAFT_14670 [Boletus reticuloceps]|uniref:RING-type domain-containing protein n=1 Tax=Boletus reticuloceps TaxID=495285 RepID=A0A8I2YRQ6_9AGAM|nr:hypothetical protein JVT61DRAFT_14670 [Boletus reticuloceps]